MTVAFENTEADAVEAILYMNRNYPSVVRNKRVLKILGWLTVAFGLLIGLTLRLKFSLFNLFSSAILIYLGLLLAVFQDRMIRRNLNSLIKSGATATLIGNHRFTPQTTGLQHHGPFGEGVLYWSGIQKVTETEQYLALHFSTSQAFLIPKRAFASAQHGAEFLRLVEKYRTEATGTPIPETSKGTWWTQTGVTEAETQNVQRGG